MITYDENKRQINKATHGLDFAALSDVFFETAAIFPAKQQRLMAINYFRDTVITVIFEFRNENVRIISMRRASRKERKKL